MLEKVAKFNLDLIHKFHVNLYENALEFSQIP